MADTIWGFSGSSRFLSNFYPAAILWEGIFYPTTEHAFNAGKTLEVLERIRVAAATTPAEAKRIGRSVQLRPGWDETVRYQVMAEVLELKFANAKLRRLLMNTGNMKLVEANDWHDTHWGICTCSKHGRGDNHLGRLLMELRGTLAS